LNIVTIFSVLTFLHRGHRNK